jgi:hypothetical protein
MKSYAVLQGPPLVFRVVASVRQTTRTLARAAAKAAEDREESGIFTPFRRFYV